MTEEPENNFEVANSEQHSSQADTPETTESTLELDVSQAETDPEFYIRCMYAGNCGLATEDEFYDVMVALDADDPSEADFVYEAILRGEATKLVLSLQRLEQIEKAILENHRPRALEGLISKQFGIKTRMLVEEYFANPERKQEMDDYLETSGFASEAVQGEAYLQGIAPIAIINRQKATDRKALFKLLKELKASREKRISNDKNAHKRSSDPEDQ